MMCFVLKNDGFDRHTITIDKYQGYILGSNCNTVQSLKKIIVSTPVCGYQIPDFSPDFFKDNLYFFLAVFFFIYF